jgi:hypothetical protein
MVQRALLWAAVLMMCFAALPGCSKNSKLVIADWSPAHPVVDTDQVILISVAHGACDTYVRAEVVETAQQVTVTALVRHSDRTCPANLVHDTESVSLGHPIGIRDLVGCRTPPQGGCRNV